MAAKILIRLEVPAVSRHFELYAPDFLPVKELTVLMINAVKELTDGAYLSSGKELLCSMEKNTILDEDATLFGYNIENGEHLMLL